MVELTLVIFLVTLCGLDVTAQEIKDAVFQSWGEVAKMR